MSQKRRQKRKQQREENKHPLFPEYKQYVREWLNGDKLEPVKLYKDWYDEQKKE